MTLFGCGGLGVLFFSFVYCSTVHAADVSLLCPKPWINSNQANLTCTLNSANFTATICDGIYEQKVNFRFQANGSNIPLPLCGVDFSSGTCDGTLNADGCACESYINSVYTFRYTVLAVDTLHSGGSWDCEPRCYDSFNFAIVLAREASEGCSSVVFGVTTTTATVLTTKGTSVPPPPDRCLRYLLLLLLLLLLPIPVPLPWPGYPIYVFICRCICNRDRSTGAWHPHYMCGKKTNDVYFSACFLTNNGRTVLIWSKSSDGRFVCYGTETTPDTSSTEEGDAMDAPPSPRNSVSAETGAVNNGNNHTSQKKKTMHTGTDGSPRKSRQPEAPVELTTVRTSSPPQAATVHGDNQASGTPHGDHQASGTPRLRPLPEPSRMTSVERNSTAEYSNMLVRDKHPKLPPIGKPDNRP